MAERRQARANLGRGYRRSSLAMLAAMRRASALILQREARSDDANELGANFMAVPPDHLVLALSDNTVDGQEHELVGNAEIRRHGAGRRCLTCRLR